MRWTQEEYEAYQNRRALQNPKPESSSEMALASAPPRIEKDTACFVCRIKSYRIRPVDSDALVGKWMVDALRYSGLLPGDSIGELDYQIRQIKVPSKSLERTEVEIIAP